MTKEYIAPEFEVMPARPAPSESFEPSPKVIAKLAQMLPIIQEIKSSATSIT